MQGQMSQKQQIFQEEYEEIEEIGRGCFGTVHRIRRKSDGRIFVWKKICYENMTQQEKIQIVNEVNVLRKLNHRNIIKYIDRIIDKQSQQIYIIMEHCDEGDLANFLKKRRKTRMLVEEDFVISVFIQLLDALHYCHTRTNKVLHRDIKPQNIFLITPTNLELQNKISEGSNLKSCKNEKRQDPIIVKLGDFGLARYLSANNQLATTHVGTPYYMSPEVLGKGQYNEKSDIWSLGCCIYELIVGKPPFYARSYDELRRYVKDGVVPNLPRCYSDELNSVLKLMFERDPLKRPSAKDIFKLDFIINKCSELSTKIELSFFMYEYQKLLSYNRYLESILLKTNFTYKKNESGDSTLDTSIDSNVSTSCSNNENYSQFANSISIPKYKKHIDDSFKKIENDFSLDKDIDNSYVTPKRNSSNIRNRYLSSESTDSHYKLNSKAYIQSPVTAPTRVNINKLRLEKYVDDKNNFTEITSKYFHNKNFKSIYNESFLVDDVKDESPLNINRSNSDKDEEFINNFKNSKNTSNILESEQRLSRWIQRFHSRNKIIS